MSVPRASVVLPAPRDHDDRPTLTVRCLGPLRVSRGTAIWGAPAARRARSVLEYLVLHRDRPVPKEVLMDHFWPEATPAAARNSLNVAIHGLRRFLREHDGCSGHVVFRNHSYLLDPDLRMWVDLDEFHARLAAARRHRRCGREDEELAELEAAEALGSGDLFEDDPYDEWLDRARRAWQDALLEVLETLRDRYLALSDHTACIRVGHRILAVEPAHEVTHRVLMCSYARQGRRHLALRQWHDCVAALSAELDAAPEHRTRQLYLSLRTSTAM